MAVKTYDPKECTLILGGVIIGGYSDGTKLSVEYTNDSYTYKTGLDGDEKVRSRSNDNSGSITLSLMSTSSSRGFLQEKLDLDKKDNTGTFSLLLKTPNEQWAAVDAWVQKRPGASIEGEVTAREYLIMCADLSDSIPAEAPPQVEAEA